MGARILLACWGSHGDLFPSIGLAIGLRARGHSPVVASSPHYRADVEREGLAFHPVRPDVDPTDPAIVARVLDPWSGPRTLIAELLSPHLREALEDTRAAVASADLVVSHPLTFPAAMAAEERDVPWLGTVLSPMSMFSVHDFPALPLAPWSASLVEALGPAAGRVLLAAARVATRRWSRPVEALRRELGLRSIGHPLIDGPFSPHGTLALFPRAMARPQPDWPEGTEATGLVPYNPDLPVPPEVLDFLDAGEPPIVFTLGSSAVHLAGRFYEESLLAARHLGRRALLLAGARAAGLPRAPDVLAIPYAPHDRVFPRACAIVHAGGIGTTGQALRAGKPMLVAPFAYDQRDNARRVNRMGVSRVCPIGRYAAPRVARDLDALLGSPACRSAAEAAGAQARAEGGAEAACDRIEMLLRPGRSSR